MSFTLELTKTLSSSSFSHCSATVVGCGYMGKEFVKALQSLHVPSIRICSRSESSMEVFKGFKEVTCFSGGYEKFSAEARPGELAIIATPTEYLMNASTHLLGLGYKRFLIEKPVALDSKSLCQFGETFCKPDLDVASAYNRVAYPSFLEGKSWAAKEGGITSCHYSMTEIASPVWANQYPKEELARWGIANSLHVASMAHGLIGLPEHSTSLQSGNAFSWHPAGNIFVGSGVSKQGIPFSYHADWTSKGRWSVEFHTRQASYLLCPLEKLFRKTSFKEPWQEIPLHVFNETVKVGIVEEVAAVLYPALRKDIPVFSLKETIRLTKFGEKVFGYPS